MPIPIRLEDGQEIRGVLGEWAQHLEEGLRHQFPALGVSHGAADDEEQVILLGERGTVRGEIVLRWDRAAPREISIFPRPPRAAAERRVRADTLAVRVAVACVIAVTALWLGAAIGFWKAFLAIGDLRGKVVVLVVAFSAWIVTTAGLAALAYYLVRRSHRAIDAPRTERSREWVDIELWPWLQVELDHLQQRAREDEALARRLAI
jgi:hypothetical protein